ncbi:fatty acid desaturase family protein [Burkholderia pseudomallei]|uniref:fatty acid desaturase family protein n=1 Tax=Burkholderia pseudomallei TaxID=28450 RepID=UPI0005390F48|nr:fatty acid desaturase [Burkholderia pseudomallei]KGX48458.1 fatty acid desaturase family protein [Burkholderia pseudomallei MSHR2138]KGX48582.1 fatty acid desaturase family protein [Burkholderia pseudomallei MSHR3709]
MTQDEWRSIKEKLPNGPTGNETLALWFLDLSLLYIAWSLWLAGGFGRLPALVLGALALLQLYLIMHEAVHNSVSSTHVFNEIVGHVCSWIIGLPFLPRRRAHLGHHAWTAHPSRDPENRKMIQKFSVITENDARTLEFAWRHWIPMIAFNHFVSHWLAPFQHRDTRAHRSKSNTELAFGILYLIGYVAVGTLAWHAGVVGNLVAFVAILWTVLLVAVELLNLPHHAEIPLLPHDAARPPLWEQDVVSHSCAHLPVWSRWVILNFNLHVVHHAYPWLPWHELPRAQRLVDSMQTGGTNQTNEWAFAVTKRRRPLLELMGHFFDKRGSAPQR